MAEGLSFRIVEDFEELRMEGGLAAGYLENIGMAFVAYHRVDHLLDKRQGPMARTGELSA